MFVRYVDVLYLCCSVLTLGVSLTCVLVQIVLALLQLVHYLRLTTMTTCVCKVRRCSLLTLLGTYVGCVFHLCFSTNCTCVGRILVI